MRKLLLGCVALAAAAPAFAGQRTAQNLANMPLIGKLAPTQYARYNPITGEVGVAKPMPNSVADTNGCSNILFDTLQVDDPTLRLDPVTGLGGPSPVGGEQCGLPGPDSRWFFGLGYNNPWIIEDMSNVDPAGFAEYCILPAVFEGNGPNVPTNLAIAITLYEVFDQNCGGIPGPGDTTDPLGGWLFAFDDVPGSNAGYYLFFFDFCGTGDGWIFPSTGSGAWEVIFLTYTDQNDPFNTLQYPGGGGAGGSFAQIMLWGASNNFPAGSGPSVGEQGPLSYNDDSSSGDPLNPCPPDNTVNNADAEICVPEECYDNSFGICPDPISGAILFLGAGGPGCTGDLDGDNDVDDSDLGLLLNSFGQNGGGDIDGDGDTDDSDLGLLLNAFNQPCP